MAPPSFNSDLVGKKQVPPRLRASAEFAVLAVFIVAVFLYGGVAAAVSQESVIDSLEARVKSDPADFESVSRLAQLFIGQENYGAAETILNDYLAIDSANARAVYLLGYVLDQTDNISVAMRSYHKSIALDSTLWQPYRDLAYLHDVFAQYDSMNLYMERAVRFAPAPESLYYDLGYSFDMLEMPDSALSYYHKAAAFDSLDDQAYLNIGAIWGSRGNFDSAEFYTDRSLVANPQSPAVCFNFAEILASKNKSGEAISYFQKALALDPTMIAVKKRLGDLYESLGDSAMAKIYFREFIDSAPMIYRDDIEKARTKLKNYK